jgi:broad specificity phosphatase PhoE
VTVFLVRHGEVLNPDGVVYAGLPGFPLTERGIIQAREAGAYLSSWPVGAVVSSPLERTMQTASEIAVYHGVDVQRDPMFAEWGLADRWAGSRWEDVSSDERKAYLTTPWDLPFAPESLVEMGDRMRRGIERLVSDVESDVVIVSHMDPIQAARVSLLGLSPDQFLVDRPVHAEVIALQPEWNEVRRWRPSVESEPFPPSTS